MHSRSYASSWTDLLLFLHFRSQTNLQTFMLQSYRTPRVLCGWCKLAPKKRLCFALDFLYQEHRAFCQFYQLLSPTQRRFGPNSVVHFAKDLRTEVRLPAELFCPTVSDFSGMYGVVDPKYSIFLQTRCTGAYSISLFHIFAGLCAASSLQVCTEGFFVLDRQWV